MTARKEHTDPSSKISEQVIAIIGTSGFKGKKLMERLEKDRRVKRFIAIDRRSPPIETKKGKYYKVDLTETLADVRLSEIFKKEKVDTVIHLAIPTTPTHSQSLSHEIISVGSMYICNACADAGVQKLILSSTTDVYGALPNNPNFLTEEHAVRGGIKNRFIADKIDAEESALRLATKNPKITVTILRPCHILGPTIQSFKSAYFSKPFVITILGYDPLIQFVHEADVIRAFMLALEKDAPGIFNIVGEGVVPLSKAVRMTGKINLPIPEWGVHKIAQLMWYSDLYPTPPSYINFLKYLCIADGEKAKEGLGFIPEYNTKEALLSYVGSHRLQQMDLDEFRHQKALSNIWRNEID